MGYEVWAATLPSAWDSSCLYQGDVARLAGFGCLLRNILAAAWPLLGLAFVAMVIWAGFQFISAGGEKEGLAKARKTLTYAVIGLFLAALAWLVLLFLQYLSGLDLTNFQLG